MHTDLKVSSWVGIRSGCPLSYRVAGDEVEFLCGTHLDGFEFVFDLAALRAFAALAERAIAEAQQRAR